MRDESNAGGVVTDLVFSGGTSVQEYSGSISGTNLAVEYIRGSDYGGGVGGILYTLRGGTPSYTHENRRGDVVAKTSATGSLTYQAQYEGFGQQTATNGSTLDRQKSNSKDTDPTNLVDEGMRYRDLETGMFVSRDPAGFVDGPNLYTYVRQNPWTSFDPKGLEDERQDLLKQEAALELEQHGIGDDTVVDGPGYFIERGGPENSGGRAPGPTATEEPEPEPAPKSTAPATTTPASGGTTSVTKPGAAPGAQSAQVTFKGNPQKTGTPGHDTTSVQVGNQMAATGNYKSIHYNQKLSTITDGAVKSGKQPDVAGVTHDGKVDVVEIPSKTQTIDSQKAKVATMNQQVGDKAGTGSAVVPIQPNTPPAKTP